MAHNSSHSTQQPVNRREASAATFAIAIMAAGKGTRLKSSRPKVLHEVGGRALLEHVIAAAAQVVDPSHIFVIVGHEADKVRSAVAGTGVNFVLQSEQRGTGHAIITARPALEKYDVILVLSGDAPLIREETIRKLRDFHLSSAAAMSILTAELLNPAGYGRVIRRDKGHDEVAAIVEQKMLTPAQEEEREINSGIYAFTTEPLFSLIGKLTTDNPHGEYYLTDMAALFVKAGKKVVALEVADAGEVLGANTIAEMALLDAGMRQGKAHELMAQGVTILRPDTCIIDYGVQIGPDSIIEPFVQLLGKTTVGAECRIRSYSVISNSEVADRVLIRNGCILDQARVGPGATIGPYSHLRPESDIGEGAHVGNFVETKKTKVGKGSKANHLSYLGDAEIGSGVNIGAGTITCNYDGVNKHRTIIEDNVFVGSDSTLVAPVTLKRGAYVAAASCIINDVPEDSLGIARAQQVVKPDWATRRRAKKAKSD